MSGYRRRRQRRSRHGLSGGRGRRRSPAFLADLDPSLLAEPAVGTNAGRSGLSRDVPHGTTIVAATFTDGVVMAGDRRATMGNVIAQRDIEKVYPADEYSCVGIAGAAGLAVETRPALPGGTRALREDRGRDAVARRQGQPAVEPDPRQPGHGHAGTRRRPAVRRATTSTERFGRIFSYDLTGGRYEEHCVPRRRIRLGLRPWRPEEAVPTATQPRRVHRGVRAVALRRRRRRLRHRWAGREPRDLSRWSSWSATAGIHRRRRRRRGQRWSTGCCAAGRMRPDGPRGACSPTPAIEAARRGR